MQKSASVKHVLIMAGGTGGHVFPGLAVARYLQNQGIAVDWLGTKQGIEAKLVPDANIPIHYIDIGGIRGKGLRAKLKAPFKIAYAIYQALKVLRRVKPNLVFGLGGFVSGPGGLACWLARRPLIIHEQNAYPGLTNKLLAQLSKRVLTGFPNTFKDNAKSVYIGNPVRQEIEDLPAPEARFKKHTALRLLVVGGSLGAKTLNDMLPEVVATLKQTYALEVYHQTGSESYEQTLAAYTKAGLQVASDVQNAADSDIRVVPFIKDMANAYAWANMVLCRAGALTVAELCAAGLGSILVPYPHAVDDHQTANAQMLVNGGAGICLPQNELTIDKLTVVLSPLAAAPTKRLALANAAYSLRKTDVAASIGAVLTTV